MRLATYNVHHGAPARGRVDLDATIEVCRALAPDVLAVQELDSVVSRSGRVDQPNTVADALGMHVAFAATVQLDERGRYGHALLSRSPLRDVELVELEVTTGREPRTAIVATTDVHGSPLDVVAVHLENPRRGDRPARSMQQAAFVFDLAALRARRSGHAAVVTGDLNLDAGPTREIAEAAGFVLAGGPHTFPVRRPSQRIDHVAVRGRTIEHVEVPAADASDHRPLLVVLG